MNTDKDVNGYLPTYRSIAAQAPRYPSICELGVAGGGSLELWQDMFPGAIVVGVDIDPNARWPTGTERVVSDQANARLPYVLREFAPAYFLIVDDASHDGGLTYLSFLNLWPLIAPDGFYVIEDWGVGFARFPGWNDSMLRTAEKLLMLLEHPASDVASITYSNGLIVLRKKP